MDHSHHEGHGHSHAHAHGIGHHHHGPTTGKGLLFSLALTTLFVIGEGIAGYFSNSLALWSDAGHNLTDALSLVLSYYAVWIAKKPADAKRSFGYHRAGILAALFNSLSLIVVALFIFWEAFHRFHQEEPVQSGVMIGVAVCAILMNAWMSFGLRKEAAHDLNIRSAYLHLVWDAVSAFGVVLAGVIIHFTGSKIADPIASILIGLLIIYSSWGVLKESIHVLLEGTPSELNSGEIEAKVRTLPGVLDVHHLHIWTVASGFYACSCHVRVEEQSLKRSQKIVADVSHCLDHDFGIHHATIQLEVDSCEEEDCED